MVLEEAELVNELDVLIAAVLMNPSGSGYFFDTWFPTSSAAEVH